MHVSTATGYVRSKNSSLVRKEPDPYLKAGFTHLVGNTFFVSIVAQRLSSIIRQIILNSYIIISNTKTLVLGSNFVNLKICLWTFNEIVTIFNNENC